MSVDLAFRAGRVVTPDGVRPAVVTVAGGRIASVGDGPVPDGVPLVDLAADEVLAPGLVDTHVHVNEPGRTEWEGFATATRAAAAGGVTTVLDMPLNSIPVTVSADALKTKQRAAGEKCLVDVGFWGGAVPEALGSLGALWDAGVFGFKCFLIDSGVPEFPPLSTDQLHAAMREIAGFGGLLAVHAEDPAFVGVAPGSPRYRDFLASRPPGCETAAIATVIEAARETGCRTHIVHLSAADALEAVEAAKADGVPLSVETCPHYLTLAAEQILDGATPFKCCPPIREQANEDRLWEGLAAGIIDMVVSDHSPSPPDLKALDAGDFGAAWGGISSLQLSLALVWTAARERGHALADVYRWMAAGPAAALGVPGKGAIAPGHDADLVVLAPEEEWTVDAGRLHHRHPVTPYDGQRLAGAVRATYLRGRRVDLDAQPGGTLLAR